MRPNLSDARGPRQARPAARGRPGRGPPTRSPRTVNGAGPQGRGAAVPQAARGPRRPARRRTSPSGPMPKSVRRPPLLEARERRRDRQLGLLDVRRARPRRRAATRWPGARPGQPAPRRRRPGRAPRSPSQQVLSGLRPPAWSHTQAATTPPGAGDPGHLPEAGDRVAS